MRAAGGWVILAAGWCVCVCVMGEKRNTEVEGFKLNIRIVGAHCVSSFACYGCCQLFSCTQQRSCLCVCWQQL